MKPRQLPEPVIASLSMSPTAADGKDDEKPELCD
jgi:hypothetical protein